MTVSLDSLDDAVFRSMNDVDFPVAKVLAGIEAAQAVGLGPIKINMVTKRGLNEASVLPMARYFKGTGWTLRFIEFMDVGHSNGWRLDDVVPAKEIVAAIDREMPLEPVDKDYRGEVADRYRYKDGGGEIGVIASVTQPFCADCTRARLSADGSLYTCLFATRGTDLRALVRDGSTDDEIAAKIAAVWTGRDDRYSELRSANTAGLQNRDELHRRLSRRPERSPVGIVNAWRADDHNVPTDPYRDGPLARAGARRRGSSGGPGSWLAPASRAARDRRPAGDRASRRHRAGARRLRTGRRARGGPRDV